jgi:hypothetical protein
MADVDALARRAVDVASTFARRAGRLAVATALFVAVIALITYVIGLNALSGSARSTWIILGGAMVVVAVGAPLLAWWRLWSARRHADELVDEVRRLITGNADARRVVIETVESEPSVPAAPGGRRPQLMVVETQQFSRLRTFALGADLRRLPRALIAVTTFPGLLAIGLLLSLVLAFLGFIFLLVWVF